MICVQGKFLPARARRTHRRTGQNDGVGTIGPGLPSWLGLTPCDRRPVLQWRGKTCILTLRPAQLPAVRAALRRYQQAQAQFEGRILAGLLRLARPQLTRGTH